MVFGSNNSQIATLVERHTRYVMLFKVDSRDTETVINALIKQAHVLPREVYKSLTWDRGKELADHKRFSLATDIDVLPMTIYTEFTLRANIATAAALSIVLGLITWTCDRW